MSRATKGWGRAALVVGSLALAAVGVLVAAFVLAASDPPVRPELPGRVVHGSVAHEGRERRWILYVPPEREPQPRPALVFALPGSGQSAEGLRVATRFRLEELAARDGFLVVYAEAWEDGGVGGYEWNDCRKNTPQPAHFEDVDDVGFLVGLQDELAARHGVDPARVYALGYSDGGQMANRLTTEHTGRFAAFASIVAQQAAPQNSSCLDPQGPIPVPFMGGTDDPLIPFDGGEASFYGIGSAGEVLSMADTIAHWRARNGTTDAPLVAELPDREPYDGSTVVRSTWRPADEHEGAPVVLYEIRGGGHTIPGGWMGLPGFLLGPTNRDVSAMDEIWSFFEGETRPSG